jgi:hypothetical protein
MLERMKLFKRKAPVTTYIERVVIERDALKDKYIALCAFLNTPESQYLPDLKALNKQSYHMGMYLTLLNERIKNHQKAAAFPYVD